MQKNTEKHHFLQLRQFRQPARFHSKTSKKVYFFGNFGNFGVFRPATGNPIFRKRWKFPEISDLPKFCRKKRKKTQFLWRPLVWYPEKRQIFANFCNFLNLQKKTRLQNKRANTISLFLWLRKTPIFALFFVAVIFLKKHAESMPGRTNSLQKHDQIFCKKKSRFLHFFAFLVLSGGFAS